MALRTINGPSLMQLIWAVLFCGQFFIQFCSEVGEKGRYKAEFRPGWFFSGTNILYWIFNLLKKLVGDNVCVALMSHVWMRARVCVYRKLVCDFGLGNEKLFEVWRGRHSIPKFTQNAYSKLLYSFLQPFSPRLISSVSFGRNLFAICFDILRMSLPGPNPWRWIGLASAFYLTDKVATIL